MGYPLNWAQLVINLPEVFPIYGSWPIQPVCCLHFLYSPAIPGSFDLTQMLLDCDTWYYPWLHLLTADYAISPIFAQVYINTPSFGVLYRTSYGLHNWQAAPVLPATHCTVIRLFASGYGKRNQGRKFFSNLRVANQVGGVLHGAGVTAANLAASHLLNPLVSQGITFQLVIPSFADDSAKPVIAARFDYRLGLIKRRGRQREQVYFPGTPFPLPP